MKKYFVRTFGCKTNQYESQVMKELITKTGNIVTEDYKTADVVIINTCCVTKPAERDIYKFLRRVCNDTTNKNSLPEIILTGCFAEYVKQNNKFAEFYTRLGVKMKINFAGNEQKYDFISNQHLTTEHKDFHGVEQITRFFGHTRAYVKIQDGCNNFCSYCIVPYLRKELYSKPVDHVLKEINDLKQNGYNEIYLVGINIGKYSAINNNANSSVPGRLDFTASEKKIDLIDLCNEILQNVNVTLIFTSLELVDLNEKFFSFVEQNKHRLFPHFHIPLQSGDNFVLKSMNRKYTTSDYEKTVNKLRKIFPEVIISTDVIVGYPEETKERFQNTLEFIKKLKLNWVHVFPYSPREGTEAYKKYGNFVPQDVKLRVREINKLNELLGEQYYKQLCEVKDF